MFESYHAGQLAIQKKTGEEEIANRRLPKFQSTLHERSVRFIERQVLAFLGSEDASGDIWISLLVGERGFIHIPSLKEVKFDLSKVISNQSDIFFKNIETNPIVGLLFHEAAKRSRYKAWGIARKEEDQVSFDITMGYKSCPKFIQREKIEVPEDSKSVSPAYQNGTTLGTSEREWISSAHTFFIATQTKKGEIETSHKGGNPGFIEIQENGVLRIPDYFGNSIYNTLGNIYENPKAALLFVDYKKGETLQITGKAALEFDQNSADDLHKSGDTGRFLTFETKQWIRTKDHHKVNTRFVDFSKFNISTNAEDNQG